MSSHRLLKQRQRQWPRPRETQTPTLTQTKALDLGLHTHILDLCLDERGQLPRGLPPSAFLGARGRTMDALLERRQALYFSEDQIQLLLSSLASSSLTTSLNLILLRSGGMGDREKRADKVGGRRVRQGGKRGLYGELVRGK
jgi:hypothetical protein